MSRVTFTSSKKCGYQTRVTFAVSSFGPGKGEPPMKKLNAALLLVGVLAMAMPATAAPSAGDHDSAFVRLLRSVVRIVHILDVPILPQP